MRKALGILLTLLCAATFNAAQSAVSSANSQPATPLQEKVKVFAVGSGVTAAELLPNSHGPFSSEKCKQKMDGKVALSILVDTNGQARNVYFIRPLGTELDRYALRMAAGDRFKPGSLNGKPVVVAQKLEMSLQTCLMTTTDKNGNSTYSVRLQAEPVQQLKPLQISFNEVKLNSDTFNLDTPKEVSPKTEPFG